MKLLHSFVGTLLLICLLARPAAIAQSEIEVQGIGLPVSVNVSLHIKKQEAFVAAILDGLKNMAEVRYWDQIQSSVLKQSVEALDWEKDVLLVSTHETIGDFKVEARSILKGPRSVIENLVDCHFQNQKIVVKDRKLIFPGVHFLQFPNWKDNPSQIGGIHVRNIEWRWDRRLQEWWCVVRLAFDFEKP